MLAETERLVGALHEPGPGAASRSPSRRARRSRSPARLMEESAALARRLRLLLHTHLAETVEEEEYCRELYGCTPVEYLDRLGWLSHDVWCAHCVHLSDEDVARFGATGVGRRPLPDVEPPARRRCRAGAPAARRGRARRSRRRRLRVERARRSLPRGQAGAARRARPRRPGGADGARGAPARHARRRRGAPPRRHRLARAGQAGRSRDLARRTGSSSAVPTISSRVSSSPARIASIGSSSAARTSCAAARSSGRTRPRSRATIVSRREDSRRDRVALDPRPRHRRRAARSGRARRAATAATSSSPRRETDEDGRARSSRTGSSRARTRSSSTRRRRSSGASSSRSSSATATTTSRSSSRPTDARPTGAADRRGARRALRGADALRRAARRREPTRSSRARTLVHELSVRRRRRRSSTRTRRSVSERGLSARSAAEQGSDDDPAVLAELARLNAEYERATRLPLRRLRQPPAEGRDPRRAEEPDRQTDATRSSRPRSASSSRSPRTDGDAHERRCPLAIDPYVTDWLDLLFRWLHVIAAIAWIGTSFYFVLLDQSLRFPKDVATARPGSAASSGRCTAAASTTCRSTAWRRSELPDHLAWFKWEAYTTWLSGFGLMVVLYYLNAHTYLIDPSVADLDDWQAVAISVGLLARRLGRLRRPLPAARRTRARARRLHPGLHGARGLGIRAAVRAAGGVPPGRRDARDDDGGERPLQHHPGALGADPRQRGRAGARPGARDRRQAPLGPQQLPDAAGALHDARRALRVHVRRRPRLARAPRASCCSASGRDCSSTCAIRARRSGRFLRSASRPRSGSRSGCNPTTGGSSAGAPSAFARVQSIVAARCAPCHALQPTQAGFSSPPAGVVLETPAQIVAQASRIRTSSRPG